MPQRDFHHDAVKQALITDGWTVTHDPYTIAYGMRRGFVDLAAERLMAAEKNGQTIAVEVKSFVGASTVTQMEQALGQYLLYRSWLARTDPHRRLFLAIDQGVEHEVFTDISGRVLIEDYGLNLLIFDVTAQRILQWKNSPITAT